jgi:hypothetical protein
VGRTLSLHPKDAYLFLGLLFMRGWPNMPSVEEQERYATELMRQRGYRFVDTRLLFFIREVTYRRDDAASPDDELHPLDGESKQERIT